MGKQPFDVTILSEGAYPGCYLAFKNDDGQRLDQFLAKYLGWLSRSQVKKLITSQFVSSPTSRLKGVRLKCSTRVAEHDQYDVLFPQKEKDRKEAEEEPLLKSLDILYEDEDLLTLNKPAGVPVHPVGRTLHRTIITALHHIYRNPDAPENDIVPKLAHRLDLETSGVLLLCKNDKALVHLSEQFRKKTIHKEYQALVYGRLEPESGEILFPLGPDENSRVPYKQRVRMEDGKPARTAYKVLKYGEKTTQVHLNLFTGRKHQLRVHLAALGHPIVGDKIYGPDEQHYFKARQGPPEVEALKELLWPRQVLHAYKLTLEHPSTKEKIVFEAPVPEAFNKVLQ